VLDEIPAVVTSETLTVYKSASTSSAELGTLKAGATVTVLAYNSTWAYVTKDGYYGYCKRAGLAPASDAPTHTDRDARAYEDGRSGRLHPGRGRRKFRSRLRLRKHVVVQARHAQEGHRG
jgi:hypothetical protein